MNNMAVLAKKVNEILLKEWDPIGVKDIQEAQDEYNLYVPDICKMLHEKKPIDEIIKHLEYLETRMGLELSSLDRLETVSLLLLNLLKAHR